jgi:hypothetical protein
LFQVLSFNEFDVHSLISSVEKFDDPRYRNLVDTGAEMQWPPFTLFLNFRVISQNIDERQYTGIREFKINSVAKLANVKHCIITQMIEFYVILLVHINGLRFLLLGVNRMT